MTDPHDPVRAQRARVARAAQLAQRSGWAMFGAALVLFVVGLLSDFPQWVANAVVASLVVGSLLLAPAIVAGYAVRAAEREDRERGL